MNSVCCTGVELYGTKLDALLSGSRHMSIVWQFRDVNQLRAKPVFIFSWPECLWRATSDAHNWMAPLQLVSHGPIEAFFPKEVRLETWGGTLAYCQCWWFASWIFQGVWPRRHAVIRLNTNPIQTWVIRWCHVVLAWVHGNITSDCFPL